MGHSTLEEDLTSPSPQSEDEGVDHQLIIPGRMRYPTPMRSKASLVSRGDTGYLSDDEPPHNSKPGTRLPDLVVVEAPYRRTVSRLSLTRTAAEKEFWAYTDELRREADRRLNTGAKPASTAKTTPSRLFAQAGPSRQDNESSDGFEPRSSTSDSGLESELAVAEVDRGRGTKAQKTKRAQSVDALSFFPPSSNSTKYPQSAGTSRSPTPPPGFTYANSRPIVPQVDGARDSVDGLDLEAQANSANSPNDDNDDNTATPDEKTTRKKFVKFDMCEYPPTNTERFKGFLRFAFLARSVWNIAFFVTQGPLFLAMWIVWGTLGRFPHASDAKYGQFAMEFCFLTASTFAFVILFVSRVAPRCAWVGKEYDNWLKVSRLRKEIIGELIVVACFASFLGLRVAIWDRHPSPWCITGFSDETQNVPENEDDEKRAADLLMAQILLKWTIGGTACRYFFVILGLVIWQVAFWSVSLLFRAVELWLGAALRASSV